MERSTAWIWAAVILAVVVGIGQESEQSWKMRPNGNGDSVQFTVRRFRPGSMWSWTDDVPLSRFHNLSASTLEHGGRAQFDYVTDAGKLVCKGSFSWNSGAGSFVFVPDPAFGGELVKLGYDAPTEEQAFSMMMSNVTLDFARGVRDAGLRATSGQLLDLRHHGVDSGFLRDLKSYGYDFSASDVIDLRNHGVSADFLRELKRAGFEFSAGEITDLRNHGVNSDFISDLKSLGLHPRAEDLVQFRNHGVSAEYLGDLKAAGYGNLTTDQIVEMRQHGVPADFASEARELGYQFTPRELIDLRSHGVNGDYLRTLKESGIRPLTEGQIVQLRQHGVN